MDRAVEREKRNKSSDRDKSRAAGKRKYERLYAILVGIFLAAVFFYTLYIGQLLWGIVIDVLILRLYFLMKQERRYFIESDLNEDEAGTPHDPEMKRKVRLANVLITLFVLMLVVYSYFTLQFIWGIVAGLMVLLYIHMLLFSQKNL
jgi:cell division septal protein FtsQ